MGFKPNARAQVFAPPQKHISISQIINHNMSKKLENKSQQLIILLLPIKKKKKKFIYIRFEMYIDKRSFN